jgi:hypothetical protein
MADQGSSNAPTFRVLLGEGVIAVVADGPYESRRDMDPFRHPDLEHLGRTLRDRLDETLNAEQSAARSAARRRRTLRDSLLESEDRSDTVVLTAIDGHTYRGVVDAVGVDHVVLVDSARSVHVAISHIVSMGTL